MPQSIAAIARSHPRIVPLLSVVLLLAALALLLTADPAGAQDGAEAYDYGQGSYQQASYDQDGQTAYYDDGEPADYQSGYSYVRNLRGDATLIQAAGERGQLELNQPVLVGDRVWVAPGSMVEVLLSDGNILRLDGDSEVVLEALAGSPETRDASTVLRLVEGNAQLVVFGDALGSEMPRVDLPNATLYVGDTGRYRMTSDRNDWSQVVVRSGWAEVATQSGSEVVRAGGEALVEGARPPRVALRQAGGFDSLERWGERLDGEVADSGYVDESLRYAAAPLDDHGSWIEVEQRRAWRPHVTGDWYPYTRGRWSHTPLGLTWVSSEPWGWVPYHYGSWDYVSHHGWVWFPGHTFSPARVHWYWGPSHVAWVPSGYYHRHYRRHYGHGFRFGVHGWVGGDWGLFANWAVCPTRYFGHRYQHRYVHDGRYWGRHDRGGHLPRGILTTDTRPLTRDRWHDGEAAIRALRTRPAFGRAAGTRSAELPDVTAFVARQGELPPDVERRIVRRRGDDGPQRAGIQPLPTLGSRSGERGSGIDGERGRRAVMPRGGAVAGPADGAGRAGAPRVVEPRAGAARPDGPRVIDRRSDEERSGDRGAASPGVIERRGGSEQSGDRGAAAPGVIERRGGSEQSGGRGAASPGVIERRGGERDGAAGAERPGSVVAPRSTGSGDDDGAHRQVVPRRVEPRASGGRDDDGQRRDDGVGRATAPRSAPPAVQRRGGSADDDRGGGAARPQTVILPGRGAGSADVSRSPRFRGAGGEARSDRDDRGREVAQPAPRSERAGSHEPPARRVVGGVLDRPSGGASPPSRSPSIQRREPQRPPAAAQRPPARRQTPTAQAPSRGSSPQRPAAAPQSRGGGRSDDRASSGRSEARRPSSPPPAASARRSSRPPVRQSAGSQATAPSRRPSADRPPAPSRRPSAGRSSAPSRRPSVSPSSGSSPRPSAGRSSVPSRRSSASAGKSSRSSGGGGKARARDRGRRDDG